MFIALSQKAMITRNKDDITQAMRYGIDNRISASFIRKYLR